MTSIGHFRPVRAGISGLSVELDDKSIWNFALNKNTATIFP